MYANLLIPKIRWGGGGRARAHRHSPNGNALSAQKSRSLFCRWKQTSLRNRRKPLAIARNEAIHSIPQKRRNKRTNCRQSCPDSAQILCGIQRRVRLACGLAICNPEHGFDCFEVELAAQILAQLGVARHEAQVMSLLVAQDELHRACAESAVAVIHKHRSIYSKGILGSRHFWHR